MTATATNTPALIAELRHAVNAIHNAACTANPTAATDIVAAQQTIAANQHRTRGPIRGALDTYLDNTTWHQGPFVLLQAIIDLARLLDIHHPDTVEDLTHQLQLFDDQ